MSDTVINMPDGSKWSPSTSTDVVQCENCGNLVDTPTEIASYPDGNWGIRETGHIAKSWWFIIKGY